MLELSQYLHSAATLLLAVAFIANLVVVVTVGRVRVGADAEDRALVSAGGYAPTPASDTQGLVGDEVPTSHRRGVGWYADRLTELGFIAVTASLVLRAIITGHAPFANQYEFATAFVWGVLLMYLYFEWKYKIRGMAVLVLPFAAGMLYYASNLDQGVSPLVPALQNSPLLTLHVASAVVAYGAAAVSVAAAALYLLRPHLRWSGMPKAEILEDISYRTIVVAFPMLTIMIVLGALWADIAWGRYWSWDPKETAALVTWLIYGAYLHARVIGGWRGNRAAWLIVLGFAAVIFTFLGNHWFGGMHSYG
ncbi:MAG TPA: c-type cytochrome biogenesis protein CcsB [Intrasporangiaceae bacterium]|nr:c-type cytochrome biogenesis protein CcsB [Intrasporangiaceae bacterium]